MKIKFQYKVVVVLMILVTHLSFSQKKDENIGTEVVNVVKPYSPTISDAFKVKETPSLEDEDNSKKENIQYTIFSFPVASTFAPNKGKASGVEKVAQEKLFSNYATLAAGNYGTINAELFVTQKLENEDYIGLMARHLSSQGGIKNIELNDSFYDTSIDATYGSKSQKISWNTDIGYQNQIYNWYGLSPTLYQGLTPENKDVFIKGINPKQSYNNVYVGGRLAFNESVLKQASIKFNRFWDAFGSGENHFVAKPSLEFKVIDEKIKLNLALDYINGSFEKNYLNGNGFTYGFTNVSLQPNYAINQDNLSINIGATFTYSLSSSQNKLFVYPNLVASYKLVGDLMIGYAGIEGGLQQNSYQDFVQNNFFVSPTLAITPTDKKFDVYLGVKGKLSNVIGYNIRGSIVNETNKALYKNNVYTSSNTNINGYALGNSFDVVYDNLKTASFFGELKADFSKNVTFGVNGTFNSYTTDIQKEAWNLPTFKVGANLDLQLTPKWLFGTNVFFVGERKDQFVDTSLVVPVTDVTLGSYFDLNAKVDYKRNEKLTFFLKGNNLANQNYQRWIDYPVQGIQVLLGANYKFDF